MERRALLKALLAAGAIRLAPGASGPARLAIAAAARQDPAEPPWPIPGSSTPSGRLDPGNTFLLDGTQLSRLQEAFAQATSAQHQRAAAAPAPDAPIAAEAGPSIAPLRRAADRALSAGPFSVLDKTATPPSGDPHDYYSVGPYWWPNPATPDGLPYIQRDGEFNPQFRDNTYDFAALDQMTKAAGTLAVAAYVTGDARYAEHTARLIRTWFLDPATRMTPHMRYSQTIPGRPGERGSGIIDARQFIAVAEAAGLLADSAAWSRDDDTALRAWFAAFLDWLQTSPAGQAEARAPNNHASWYAAQIAAYAKFARQPALARQILAARGPALIADQIEPDGRQPRELARTRPFHYSAFNLEALTALALLDQHDGAAVWRYQTDDGRGLRPALDYLIPFATGAAPWPHPDRDFDARALAPLLARAARALPDAGYAALIPQVFPDAGYAALIPQVFPDATPLQQLYLRLGIWWTRG